MAKINELMQQELPQLVDERRFRRREQEQVERDEYGRVSHFLAIRGHVLTDKVQRKWPEEKIPISLEPIPGFNLRAQVVGHGGAYVKHIQQETGCRVQIKGRGSGYIENATGRESDEDMFLHVAYVVPSRILVSLANSAAPEARILIWSRRPRSSVKICWRTSKSSMSNSRAGRRAASAVQVVTETGRALRRDRIKGTAATAHLQLV